MAKSVYDEHWGKSDGKIQPHWVFPEGGPHGVAIESSFYEACASEIDNYFGRPIDKWSHNLTLAGTYTSYVIFTFKEKTDADRFAFEFEGEPMNPGDKGRGKHWMYWYPGRSSRRAELAKARNPNWGK